MFTLIELRQVLVSYQDHHMFTLIELRQVLISYQDHHMFTLIELRQVLISYQDYHTILVLLTRAGRDGNAILARGSSAVVEGRLARMLNTGESVNKIQ